MQTRFIVRTLVTSTLFLICSAGILTALASVPGARYAQNQAAQTREAGYEHENAGHAAYGRKSDGREIEAVNNSHFRQNQD